MAEVVKIEKRPSARGAGETYSMVYSAGAWGAETAVAFAPVSNIEEHAAHLYREALSLHTDGKVSGPPRHVKVVAVERNAAGPARRVVLRKDALPPHSDARVKWLYIVEADEAARAVEGLGGISFADFRRRAVARAATLSIMLGALDPLGFYDRVEFERENSLPPVPEALASPPVSVMSLSASSGGLAPPALPSAALATSVLLDYADDLPPAALARLRQVVAPHVPLPDLLRMRYEQMQSVARFCRDHRGTAAEDVVRVAAHGASAALVHAATSIASLAPFAEAMDANLQHAVHVMAHWLVRRHVLPRLKPGEMAWRWFVEQETRLVALHLRFAAPESGPAGVLRTLAEPVLRHFDLRAAAAPPPLLLTRPHAAWYTIDSVEALVRGLPTLRNGARAVHIDARTNQMYLTIGQVLDDLLPLFVEACVRGEVACCGATAGLSDDETTSLVAVDDDDDDAAEVARAVAEIVADRMEVFSGAAIGFHLPRNDVDPHTLPHLENATAPRALYPLCAQRLWHKLVVADGHHLKFGERLEYGSLLRDLGYPVDRIVDHAQQHFHDASQADFHTKYVNNLVSRKEAGLWEDGVRTVPYGMSCQRKIDGKDLPGDNRGDPDICVACPYARLHGTRLKKDLREVAGLTSETDIEDIAAIATMGNNPQGACAEHFRRRFARLPSSQHGRPRAWPRAPRAFVQEALALVRPVIARGNK